MTAPVRLVGENPVWAWVDLSVLDDQRLLAPTVLATWLTRSELRHARPLSRHRIAGRLAAKCAVRRALGRSGPLVDFEVLPLVDASCTDPLLCRRGHRPVVVGHPEVRLSIAHDGDLACATAWRASDV